jgi:putative membrane protein
MMWDWGNGAGWGWMLMMGLFMVLLIAGIVFAVVFAGRATSPSQGGQSDAVDASRAKAILEERFARGEIDEDEFQRRTQVLDRR